MVNAAVEKLATPWPFKVSVVNEVPWSISVTEPVGCSAVPVTWMTKVSVSPKTLGFALEESATALVPVCTTWINPGEVLAA